MDELVSRKALLERLVLVPRFDDGNHTWLLLDGVEDIINQTPAEQPREVPIAVVQFNEEQLRDIISKAVQDLADDIEHGNIVLKEDKPNYEYTAVRSYASGCNTAEKDLLCALKEGWEVVRASEYCKNSNGYSDFIEYILRREKGGDSE